MTIYKYKLRIQLWSIMALLLPNDGLRIRQSADFLSFSVAFEGAENDFSTRGGNVHKVQLIQPQLPQPWSILCTPFLTCHL